MIRSLIGRSSRRALSREVCRRLDWRKPDGGLKERAGGHVAHARRDRPAAAEANADRTPVPGPATDRPLFPVPERLADVQPVAAEPVRNAGEGRLWNEFVARYHCHSTLPGAQHFVRAAGGEPLAVLGFGAAAWKIAPRDELVEPRDPPPQPAAGGQQCPGLALGQKSRVPSLWSNDGCRTTGSAATLRSCSRPSAKRRASKEAATGPPARPAKHRAAAAPGKNALSRSRTLKPLRRDWRRSLNK